MFAAARASTASREASTRVQTGIEYMTHLADWYTRRGDEEPPVRRLLPDRRRHRRRLPHLRRADAPPGPASVEDAPAGATSARSATPTTSYGIYSGAVPNEKITWGKLAVDTPQFIDRVRRHHRGAADLRPDPGAVGAPRRAPARPAPRARPRRRRNRGERSVAVATGAGARAPPQPQRASGCRRIRSGRASAADVERGRGPCALRSRRSARRGAGRCPATRRRWSRRGRRTAPGRRCP